MTLLADTEAEQMQSDQNDQVNEGDVVDVTGEEVADVEEEELSKDEEVLDDHMFLDEEFKLFGSNGNTTE